MDVDSPPGVALEARVEEVPRVRERGALDEGDLDVTLVGLTGADEPVMRPHRDARGVGWLSPLHLFDRIRIGLLNERADASERRAPPVARRGARLLRRALLRWVRSASHAHDLI